MHTETIMKQILIDSEKCTGCRTCEVICSLTHTKGEINPRRARVRVYRDEVEGIYTPIIPGLKTSITYVHRPRFLLQGKTGDINLLCNLFADPSHQCNQCGMCATWCSTGALTIKEVQHG